MTGGGGLHKITARDESCSLLNVQSKLGVLRLPHKLHLGINHVQSGQAEEHGATCTDCCTVLVAQGLSSIQSPVVWWKARW